MKNSIKLQILALFIACQAALNAGATIVSFGFSGKLEQTSNPFNVLPVDITYGTPFTGIFTYDTSTLVNGADFNLSPDSGNYYFNTNGGFLLSVTIAGHTFSSIKHGPVEPYAAIIIHNDYFGYDSFNFEDSFPNVVMDGGPRPGNPDASSLILALQDNSATALNSDALPLTPPSLAGFPDAHRFEVIARKGQNQVFDLSGQITEITATPQPTLISRSQPNKTVLLSWPLAAQGFGLQQSTNLTDGIGWQTDLTPVWNTATGHTVTVLGSGSKFFRLELP